MNLDYELKNIIDNFETMGQDFVVGKRNKIKTFEYKERIINIKSFKIPIFINGLIYKFFRDSKAKRSYKNALILLENNIKTPKPIGYYEEFKGLFLKKSYYISEHFEPDLIFRDVFGNEDKYELEKILIGLANFTFQLHEKGIDFIDHSSGNTLIKKDENGIFQYYLVDLNRMNFHQKMSLKQRIFNMRKLAPSEYFLRIISKEYARLYNISEDIFFKLLIKENEKFQHKFYRKKEIKKKLIFWKS